MRTSSEIYSPILNEGFLFIKYESKSLICPEIPNLISSILQLKISSYTQKFSEIDKNALDRLIKENTLSFCRTLLEDAEFIPITEDPYLIIRSVTSCLYTCQQPHVKGFHVNIKVEELPSLECPTPSEMTYSLPSSPRSSYSR